MKLMKRFLPTSLIGQVMLAFTLSLAVSQIINFAIIANGQRQNKLAQLAMPAATRISDAVERMAAGIPLPQPLVGSPRGPRRPLNIVQTTTSQVGPSLDRWPELETRISEILQRNDVVVRQIQAGTGYLRGFGPATPISGPQGEAPWMRRPQLVVSAEIAPGQWVSIRARAQRDNAVLPWLLLFQTLLIFVLMMGPVFWIAWRVIKPLQLLKDAAIAPLLAGGGDPLPLSGPADVRELTAAFNDMRTRLAGMLGEKDRMLGAIGHDLRTPLASLRVRAEQVPDPVLGAKMATTVDEMAAILDDILDIARIGQSREPRVPTDIAALIEAVVADYADDPAFANAIHIDSDSAQNRPVLPVRGILLRRAIRNLIDNALKHGGGDVRITWRREPGGHAICISDSGPGIPEDRLVDMLEPFSRSDYSRNSDHGGVGLGLALVKAIIEGEGGRLSLANAAHGGLIVTLHIPADSD